MSSGKASSGEASRQQQHEVSRQEQHEAEVEALGACAAQLLEAIDHTLEAIEMRKAVDLKKSVEKAINRNQKNSAEEAVDVEESVKNAMERVDDAIVMLVYWLYRYFDAASGLPSPRWQRERPQAVEAVSKIRRSLALAPDNGSISISAFDQLDRGCSMRGRHDPNVFHVRYNGPAGRVAIAIHSLANNNNNNNKASIVSDQLQLIRRNLQIIASST